MDAEQVQADERRAIDDATFVHPAPRVAQPVDVDAPIRRVARSEGESAGRNTGTPCGDGSVDRIDIVDEGQEIGHRERPGISCG
jgi:hypothetical protein